MNRVTAVNKPEKMTPDSIETPPKIRIGPASAEIGVVKRIQAMKARIKSEAAKLKRKENGKIRKSAHEENDSLSEGKKSAMEVEPAGSKGQANDIDSSLQPPKEFEAEFIKKYFEFLDCCKEVDQAIQFRLPSICHDREEQQNSKMKYLLKVYYLAGQHYYEANSLQIWDDIATILTPEEKAVIGNVKSFYQHNLFLFEKYSNSSQSVEDIEAALDLDTKWLTDPYILRPHGELTKEFYRDVLEHQAVLLKGFVDHYDISQTLFSVEHIAEAHAKDVIDVVFQNPYLYGFVQDPEATFQYKKQMSIQDYYNYQLESEAQEPQNVTDEHGMIKFGVNIDIEEWKKEMHELQNKLPKEFLFNSDYDAMSYSTQKIKGINLPQLYMKVEGAWTGGHEENLRLRAINLNHGPGSSVWFTINVKHARTFRKLIKEHYNLDIHKDEGLWFGDIDTCIKNGIEIQYFVQEPGDIVLLGPGCLHWVRCTGIATNSAWNFLSKDKLQFEKGFERYDINKEIDFKSLIPLRHIAQTLLFKETFTLSKPLQDFLVDKLAKFYDEELQLYHDFKQKYPDTFFMYENEGNSVFNCVACNHETLNYYVYCYGCSEKKPEDEAILICLKCYEAHKQDCKKHNKTYFYFKMSQEVIKDMKEKLQNLEDLKKDHKSLGHYMKNALRSDREAKYKEWQKSFNQDSPSNRALKTKPFNKKRLTGKPQHDIEKIQEMSREKTRQYALQEKTKKSLMKNGHRDSDEKEKVKNKHKLMKNSSRDAFEESRKYVKELELKKSASPIHDPPSDDEETLQDDKTKYRIKKKTKLEEDGSGSKSNGNSIGFSQLGGLLGNSSRFVVQDRIENPFVAFKTLTTGGEGSQSSGANDGFFLGKLSSE